MHVGQSVRYAGVTATVVVVYANAVMIVRESGACFTVTLDDSNLDVEPESSMRP